MMETIGIILVNMALLFTLWWLYFVEYKRYRLDLARRELFSVRNDLFEAAANGKLSFDSLAYGMTRRMLNGSIRFMHGFGFVRLATLILVDWAKPDVEAESYSKEFKKALSALTPEGRKEVQEALFRMHLIIISHVIHNSLLLTVVLKPLLLCLRLTRKLGEWQYRFVQTEAARRRFAPVDVEAKHHCPA